MITVDPLREYQTAQIKPGARHAGRRWCHLEDTEGDTERLHAFAARIGIPRRWFQIGIRGTFPHYDLTPRYRLKAVQAGAIELTSEDSRTITHEVCDRPSLCKGRRALWEETRPGRSRYWHVQPASGIWRSGGQYGRPASGSSYGASGRKLGRFGKHPAPGVSGLIRR